MDGLTEKSNNRKAMVWNILKNVLLYAVLAGIIAATFIVASMY